MKIKERKLTRLFTAIMAILILLVSLPMSVFANEINSMTSGENIETAISNESESERKAQETIVLNEEISLREENVKHFKLSDGTIKAVAYSQAVHYKDSEGNWVDINNALTLNGKEYSSKNKLEIKFSNKADSGKLVSIKDGDYKIDFSPLNANNVSVEIENPQNKNSLKFKDVSTLDNIVSKAIYKDIYSGIDIEYILVGNNIKENIIVKEKKDEYSFSFELKLNNLKAELVDGVIALSDYESGERVYEIPKPYMLDANKEYSESVEYELIQNSKWKYTFTIKANSEWVNAEKRVFPVIIDPMIEVESNYFFDYTSVPPTEENETQNLVVGDGYVSYIGVSSLPTLPKDAYLTDATVSLKHISGAGLYVGVFEDGTAILSDYNNIAPHSVESINSDGSVSTTDLYGENGWFTWNVYEILNKWYNNKSTGALRINTLYGEGKIVFASEEIGNDSCPVLEITYRDMKGIESYFGYVVQNVGSGGTGMVNLATGNLIFEIGTMTTTEGFFGFTPSLIYNSAIAGEEYKYSNAQAGYTFGYTANGFKSNMTETIIKKSYINTSNEEIWYYVWADADGTEHYFEYSENGLYYDEDGLEIYLYEDNEDNTCKLIDSSKNKKIFSVLYEENDAGEKVWYLTKIQDNSGNELLFCFDGSKKPNDIKFTPSGTEQTTVMISPLYNSDGKMTLLWSRAKNEGVLFRHSATPQGEISETGGKYLRQVLRVKCTSSQSWTDLIDFIGETDNEAEGITVDYCIYYDYDESGRLISVYDSKLEYGVEYSYTENRISGIREYSGSTLGQAMTIAYGAGYTEIRTSGKDDLISTTDDIINVYLFDSYGRIINTYSTNFERTEIYGAASGKFETENEAVKNGIKESAFIGIPQINYIANGDFEMSDVSLDNWSTNNAVLITTANEAWDNSKAKITVSDQSETYLKQTVLLKKGEYTFSLAINESSLINAKSYLRVSYGDFEKSVELSLKDLSLANGLSFQSLTFEVPASAISQGEDSVAVTVGIYLVAENSQASGSCEVDNVMVARFSGMDSYNHVNFSGITETSDTEYLTTGKWEYNEEYSNVVTENNEFGDVIRISGSFSNERVVEQRLYVASLPAVNKFFNSLGDAGYVEGITNTDIMFTLSGFGKSQYAINNEQSKFAVYLEIQYKCLDEEYYCYTNYECCADLDNNCCSSSDACPNTCRASCGYKTERIYAEFNSDNGNWQFALNTFILPANSFVNYIDVGCEYTRNIDEAYFDNIAVQFEKIDNSQATIREYYPNGKLKAETSGVSYTIYGYDSETGMVNAVITNNTYTEYQYDENYRVICQINKAHNDDVQYVNVDNFETIKESITAVEQNRTIYEYTSYGQLKKTETSKGENGKKIVTSYTYYDDKITSKIFGAIKTITTDNETTTYLYNENSGQLVATVNDDGRGEGYSYDSLGKLVGVYPITYTTYVNQVTDDIRIVAVYNENGLVEKIRVLDSETEKVTEYSISYDPFGNQNEIYIGENEIISCEYNSNNGKLKKVIYSNGTEFQYTYDNLERVSELLIKNGDDSFAYKYEYNSNGNLSRLIDEQNQKISVYKYDVYDRLIKVIEYDIEEKETVSSQSYLYNDSNLLTNAYYYSKYLLNNASERITQYYNYTYDDENLTLTNVLVGIYDNVTEAEAYNISYKYDEHYRVTEKDYSIAGSTENDSVNAKIEYVTDENNQTLSQISKYSLEIMKNELTILEKEFNYSYNESNYIFEIYDSFDNRISKYTYDSKGRLISEANDELGRIFTYSYDNNGNILTENVYDTNMTLLSSNSYLYNSENGWSDQLTSYNGSTITYDSIGNPLLYKDGMSMSWENGKELSQIIKGEDTFSYKYNSQGIRIGKTVNGVEHIYTLEGSRILSESYGNITMLYIYDETNSPIGIAYRENDYAKGVFDYYLYLKNLQGDIIGICNSSYELISEYTYNAWGECTITNYTEDNIGNVNPFRYRGYYHDSETGFYYLNSRYYDSQIKRFINADDISYMDPITLTGINLYAYCDNNPVMYVDPSGHFIISSFLIGLGISTLIGAASGGIFYVGSELVSYATTGQFSWSWSEFFGSVAGGAFGGLVGKLFEPLKLIEKLAGAMTSGFTSVFMGDFFEFAINGAEFDIGSTLKRSVQTGLFSMVATGLTFKFFPKKSTILIPANAQKEIKKIYYSFAGIFKDFYNQVSDDLFYGYWDMVHSAYSKYYND